MLLSLMIKMFYFFYRARVAVFEVGGWRKPVDAEGVCNLAGGLGEGVL